MRGAAMKNDDILGVERNFAALSTKDLLEARDQYHCNLIHKENVVGTAIGLYRIRKSDPWPTRDRTDSDEARSQEATPKGERTLDNSEVRDYKVFDTAGNLWDPAGGVPAAPRDVILNVRTGGTKNVPGVGAGDEVWFNAGDGNYYATGSGSPFRPIDVVGVPPIPLTAQGSTPLGVIDAENRKLIQSVPTFNVPAVTTGPAAGQHPAGTAHSVA